jgi:hypothetical protein
LVFYLLATALFLSGSLLKPQPHSLWSASFGKIAVKAVFRVVRRTVIRHVSDMKPKNVLLHGLIVGSLGAAGMGQDASDRQAQAYRSSVAQDTLRRDAAGINTELLTLLTEVAKNKLTMEDVVVIEKALREIQGLSQNEMQQAVELLRQASTAQDAQNQNEKLLGAYQDQQTISARLRKLAVELQARQDREALYPKLQMLVSRQSGNLAQTLRVQQTNPNRKKLNNESKQKVQMVLSEQNGLASDIATFVKAVENLEAELPADQKGVLPKLLATATQNDVVHQAQAAATAGADETFDPLIEAEKKVEAGLLAMLNVLASEMKVSERIEQAIAQVDKLIEGQKAVEAMTETSKNNKQNAAAAQRQTDVADNTEAARKQVQAVDGKASAEMAAAQQAMEKSSEALTGKGADAEAAKQAQSEAAAKLENVKQQLASQLADARKQEQAPSAPMSPADVMNQLAQLQSQTQQAASEQGSLNNSPSSAAQQALADKVAELQQQALQNSSPEAAQALGKAAENMQSAAQSAQGSADQQAASQQASQALSDASQAIQQQMAANQSAVAAQQAMQSATNQVAQAQQASQQAQQTLSSPSQSGGQAYNQLSQAQQALSQAQQALSQAQSSQSGQASASPSSQPSSSSQMAQSGQQPPSGQQSASSSSPSSQSGQASASPSSQPSSSSQMAQSGQQSPSGQQSASSSSPSSQSGQASASPSSQPSSSSQMAQSGQQSPSSSSSSSSSSASSSPATQAQQALSQAQQALATAALQAAQSQKSQASASNQAAQAAMSQAQQALAQATAAMAGATASSSASQDSQGSAQQASSAGLLPGSMTSSSQGGASQSQIGMGSSGYLPGSGPTANVPAQVITGLSPKDRQALTLLQSEKPPREYTPQVQQYQKNLADGAGSL